MTAVRPALSDFRIEAYLDWIELKLTLAKPTQARHLRAALPPAWCPGGKAPYVRAASGTASTTDTVFILRVQDPPSARAVFLQLEQLQTKFPLAAPAAVTGVEVGIDAYPRHAAADVVGLTEHLYRGLACPTSDNRRITGERGTRDTAQTARGLRRDNQRALASGQTIFIGDAGADVTQRVYFKEQTRARYEVTLTGAAVPFETLEGWASFQFQLLSNWFRWRMPNVATKESARPMMEWLPTLTREGADDARRRHRRQHVYGTVADAELRDAALLALRRLTTAQRRGWQSGPTARRTGPAQRVGQAENPMEVAAQVLDGQAADGCLLKTILLEDDQGADVDLDVGVQLPLVGHVRDRLHQPARVQPFGQRGLDDGGALDCIVDTS